MSTVADKTRIMTAIRIMPNDLAEIDRRAKAAELSRTEYLIRKALDRPLDERAYSDRLDDLERRLEALESE